MRWHRLLTAAKPVYPVAPPTNVPEHWGAQPKEPGLYAEEELREFELRDRHIRRVLMTLKDMPPDQLAKIADFLEGLASQAVTSRPGEPAPVPKKPLIP